MCTSIKKFGSVCMSVLMFCQMGGYGSAAETSKRAKAGNNMSFGDKIKYGFGALKEKISQNPKKSKKAAIGGGIGVGTVLLLVGGIIFGKSRGNKNKGAETQTPRPAQAPQASEKIEGKEETAVKIADEFDYTADFSRLFSAEQSDLSSQSPVGDGDSSASSTDPTPVSSSSPIPEEISAGSPSSTNVSPLPVPMPVPTAVTTAQGATSTPDAADTDPSASRRPSGITVIAPRGEKPASEKPAVASITVSRSPSPNSAELKILGATEVSFDKDVRTIVNNFCRTLIEKGANCTADNLLELIGFLAKIENRSKLGVQSILESNATRLEQLLAKKAEHKFLTADDLRPGLRAFNQKDWEDFKRFAKACGFDEGNIQPRCLSWRNFKKTLGSLELTKESDGSIVIKAKREYSPLPFRCARK